jgi:hypothetical protein
MHWATAPEATGFLDALDEALLHVKAVNKRIVGELKGLGSDRPSAAADFVSLIRVAGGCRKRTSRSL